MTVQAVSNAAPATPSPESQALRKAAQRFEAIFLREMIASMRKAQLAEDVFGSSATNNFRELGDARLADSMAENSSFGIADLIEQQMRQAGGIK